MKKSIKVKIEKLVFGGQGFGYADGSPVFVWNALPGETVVADIVKKKKGVIEAVAVEIIQPSKDRIDPQEPEHFLSCSPWQCMSFDAENEWKKKISIETYNHIGKLPIKDIDIVFGEKQYGYRNKMEYSFWYDDDGKADLAFFARARHYKVAIENCALADPAINEVAGLVKEWVNARDWPARTVKSLIVRSNQKGETIAALYIKEELPVPVLPELPMDCKGFTVFYSRPNSPASTADKLLAKTGQDWLEESVKNTSLRYGLESFFQVNVSVFESALFDIEAHLDPDKSILDYYAGVGAIGLSLSKGQRVTLVEENEEAVRFAHENIGLNGLKDCEAFAMPSEKMIELIESGNNLIFDPPRAGLHEKVTKRVLEVLPEKVIYLSCNLSTQARDIGLLLGEYDIIYSKLYNFFPRTPHVEGLVVLQRK